MSISLASERVCSNTGVFVRSGGSCVGVGVEVS